MAQRNLGYKIPSDPWKYGAFRGKKFDINRLRWACNKEGIDISDNTVFDMERKTPYQKALRDHFTAKKEEEEKAETENDVDDKLQEVLKQDTEARAAQSMSHMFN